jgi:hypothetical protein
MSDGPVAPVEIQPQTPMPPQGDLSISPEYLPPPLTITYFPPQIEQSIFPNGRKEAPIFPSESPNLTPGQKEVGTYALLDWCAVNKRLPPDPKAGNNIARTIVFDGNLPLIGNAKALEITAVTPDGNFVCRVEETNENGEPIQQEKTFAASDVLVAQRIIVENSTEIGAVKGSVLRNFLESSKYQADKEQQLTTEQQKFNEEIQKRIEQLNEQIVCDPQTVAEIVKLVFNEKSKGLLQQLNTNLESLKVMVAQDNLNPDQINMLTSLQEIITNGQKLLTTPQARENLIKELETLLEKQDDLQQIDLLNEALNSGNILDIAKIISDEDGKNPQRKEKILKFIKGGSIILALAALILIWKSAQGNRQQQGGMLG